MFTDKIAAMSYEKTLNILPTEIGIGIDQLLNSGANAIDVILNISQSPLDGLSTKGGTKWNDGIGLIVVKEMHLLFCTDDAKYEALRQKIDALSGQIESAITSMISLAVAAKIGVQQAIISHFILVFILGFLKVGKEASCSIAGELIRDLESKPK